MGGRPGARGGLARAPVSSDLRPLGVDRLRSGDRRAGAGLQHHREHRLEAAGGALHRAAGARRLRGAEPLARGRALRGPRGAGAGVPARGARRWSDRRRDRGDRAPRHVRVAALPGGGQRRAVGRGAHARRDRAAPGRPPRRGLPARRAGRAGAPRGVAPGRGLRRLRRGDRASMVAARARRPGHVRPVDRARLAGLGGSAAHLPPGPHQRRAGHPAGDGRSRARPPARHGNRSRRRRCGSARCAAWPSAGAPEIAPWPPSLRRGGVGSAHRRRDRPRLSGGAALPRRARGHLLRPGRDRRRRRGAPGVPPPRPRCAGGGPARRVRPVRRLPRRRVVRPGGRCEGSGRDALGALARRRPSQAASPGRAPAPDRPAGRPGERPGLEARPAPQRLWGAGSHRRWASPSSKATTPPSSRGCGVATPPRCD